MTAIEVTHLKHAYGKRQALAGISFEVDSCAIFGFLGPNGGGKTTLFHLLSTLLPIQDGNIQALGFDVARQAAVYRQKLGVMFQSPSLDRRLTVRENLIHQGQLYGLSGASLASKAEEMLTRFGVGDRASDIVETLSGGLKRRVELAKTMLHDPELLLLDEPSTGLDPGARHEMWKYLEQLRSENGVTVVVTTHLMEEAEHCDRLALLDQGNIVAEGSPSALRSEIPGECLTLTCSQTTALKTQLADDLNLNFTRVGETLRIHQEDCQTLFTQVMDQFGSHIESISLGKPTLEDVFMAKTGRAFSEDEE